MRVETFDLLNLFLALLCKHRSALGQDFIDARVDRLALRLGYAFIVVSINATYIFAKIKILFDIKDVFESIFWLILNLIGIKIFCNAEEAIFEALQFLLPLLALPVYASNDILNETIMTVALISVELH